MPKKGIVMEMCILPRWGAIGGGVGIEYIHHEGLVQQHHALNAHDNLQHSIHKATWAWICADQNANLSAPWGDIGGNGSGAHLLRVLGATSPCTRFTRHFTDIIHEGTDRMMRGRGQLKLCMKKDRDRKYFSGGLLVTASLFGCEFPLTLFACYSIVGICSLTFSTIVIHWLLLAIHCTVEHV